MVKTGAWSGHANQDKAHQGQVSTKASPARIRLSGQSGPVGPVGSSAQLRQFREGHGKNRDQVTLGQVGARQGERKLTMDGRVWPSQSQPAGTRFFRTAGTGFL